jgi:undecaprenyl-diphosphatase
VSARLDGATPAAIMPGIAPAPGMSLAQVCFAVARSPPFAMHASSPASTAMAPPRRLLASSAARLLLLGLVLLVAGVTVLGVSLDKPLFFWMQRETALLPAAFWSAWSVLGLGLSAALLAALFADETMAPVATMLWSLLLGGLVLQAFKHVWPMPRPLAVLPADAVHVIGAQLRAGSLPSGHSAMIAALGCALARAAWPRARALVPVIALLAALGCIARVAVGAHWPSDVLVGAAVGVLSVAAGDAIDARWSLRAWLATANGMRLFAIVQLVAAVVLLGTRTGYPLALPIQWLLGVASIVSAVLRWRTGARAAAAGRAA